MKRFWDFFRVDWLRKLFALIFTLIVYWNLNELRQKEQSFQNVPLEINLASDLFMSGRENIPPVNITVRGTEESLRQLNFSHPTGKINIDSSMCSADGKCRIVLKPEHFPFGRRNKIMGVSPQVLEFSIQRQITRELPILPDIKGLPSPGFALAGFECVPAKIQVTGPEDTVEALDYISTNPLNDNLGDTDLALIATPVNPLPDRLNIPLDKVRVKIRISPSPDTRKSFRNVAVCYLANTHFGQKRFYVEKITPAAVQVTITGNKSEVEKIRIEDIRIYADLSAGALQRSGEIKVPLTGQIISDTKVTLLNIIPSSVTASIKNDSAGSSGGE